jgi:hypothetical protein
MAFSCLVARKQHPSKKIRFFSLSTEVTGDSRKNTAAEEKNTIRIYSDEITERLTYTARFIFKRVLRVPYDLTTDISASPHITYSSKKGHGVTVFPAGLLTERGVAAKKPVTKFEGDRFYLFPVASDGFDLPSDVFSAVFFCISRYEEWQDFQRDIHGRFEAPKSIFFGKGGLLVSWVDRWIEELRQALKHKFPEIEFPGPESGVIATIDVDNLFAFRNKGLVRTAGGMVKDVLRGDLKGLSERVKVVYGGRRDPFDVYDEVVTFCKERHITLKFFFLYGGNTPYDRSITPSSGIYGPVFRLIHHGGAEVGLHPSYETWKDPDSLRSEKQLLESHAGSMVTGSRQHYLRFDIRITPKVLMQAGIATDYTMGFASAPGFRAGTAHPFRYYDFDTEKEQPLLFIPFCAMDGAFTVYDRVDPAKALGTLRALHGEVKRYGGLFVTCFHERTFSERMYPGFGKVFFEMFRS